MKKRNGCIRRSFRIFLVLALLCGTLPVITFAADEEVRVAVNGAAANYAPGSVMVLYGRLESGEVGLPDTDVAVKARIGNSGTNFYVSQATTDENGYFKAGFNVPTTATAPQKLFVNVDGTDVLNYTLQTQASINAAGEEFKLLGFTAPGYLEGETVRKIAASTTELGIVFNKNVNYFRNQSADSDLQNLGINLKNKDCFRLYKGATGTADKVDISIHLLESGGTTTAEYTKLDGTINEEQKKDIIYIDLEESLAAGTTYRLVVDGELASNSSSTLGDDQTIYFTTASSGGGSSGSSGLSDTGTTGDTTGGTVSSPAQNDISLSTTPSYSNGKANVAPTDSQIEAGLKNVVAGEKNVLKIELTDEDFSAAGETVGEVGLSFTAAQIDSLEDGVEELVYETPIGTVVIPKEVLSQTSGNVTLDVKKTGEDDSFEVTLTDTSGRVTKLSGRVSLVLPVENADNNVVLHNGVIMKNAWIEDGNMYAVTKGFSVFSAAQKDVTFSDIANHWAKESIEFLAVRSIVAGSGNGTFSPDGNVTRAEFVKMMAGAFDEVDASTAASAGFSDVADGAWYADSVNWAAENGIVKGTGADTFDGSSRITRQDLAVMLYRLADELEITLDADTAKTEFTDDANIKAYAKDAVYALQQAGILSGKSGGSFDPAGYATRAETAVILTSFIKEMAD